MHSSISITPAQLPDVLLHVAVTRPVFLWGQPGIGKSSLVADFAKSLGLDCVSLLGTQLAPEDLIGVPQIFDTPKVVLAFRGSTQAPRERSARSRASKVSALRFVRNVRLYSVPSGSRRRTS